MTALAIEWEAAEDIDAGVSTLQLGNDVFASTIQASMAAGEVPADDLDDAETERSIREINEAIQRSSQKKR